MNTRSCNMDQIDQLSELNIQIYNFKFVQTQTDALRQAVEALDTAFAGLNAESVCTIVNNARKKAKMPEVSANDIVREINRKRADVRQMITEKVAEVPESTYVELITQLAQQLPGRMEGGGVIDDLVDQYEIRMHDRIQQGADEVKAAIAKVKSRSFTNQSKGDQRTVNSLIQKVREWDFLAQPVQLKAQSSGMTHEVSQQLGKELRELAIYLHNEKNATSESVRITRAMRAIFAELPEFAELLEKDEALLKKQEKEQQIVKGFVKACDSLRNTANELTSNPSWPDYMISDQAQKLLDSARSLDKTIKETQSLDEDTRNQFRKTACMIIREAAIKLHNEQHKTRIAADMTKHLMDIYGDFAELKDQLQSEYQQLKDQLQNEYQQLEKQARISSLPARIEELRRKADNYVDEGYYDYFPDNDCDSYERDGRVVATVDWERDDGKWTLNTYAKVLADELLDEAKDLDRDIKYSEGLEEKTKYQLRTAVCMVVRNTAIRLYNERFVPRLAAYMCGELLRVYEDLPEQYKQLSNVHKQLSDADFAQAQKLLVDLVGKGKRDEAAAFARSYQQETGRSLLSSNGQNTSSARTGSETHKSSSSGGAGLIGFILFIIFAIISSSSGWI